MEYSIKAFSLIHKKINAKYYIAGDGTLRKSLEQLCSTLGISDQVIFLGLLDTSEVYDLYCKTDVFVLTSVTAENGDQEGIPVVLMEAAALGIPIVSSIHTGIPELVIDGENGFLLEEKAVDDISVKMLELYNDEKRRKEMGERSKQVVNELFNEEKQNNRLLKILEKKEYF